MERVEPASGSPEIPPESVSAPVAVAPLPVVEPPPFAMPVEELPLPVPEPVPEPLPESPPIPAVVEPSAPEPPDVMVLISPSPSRRLAESLIIFVSAILFLRALAVEPFGVPTGSMSPTLIGNHKVANCPRCGYTIRVGEPSKQQAVYPKVVCPNCGKPEIDINSAPEIAGDRLLVDKNVYSLRKPRRWEPAVFRCPSDMTKPYVKRVVGLPGERIFVHDGDIYINDQLSRKTLRESRETRVPIFDMNFPPTPNGWTKHWVVESRLPLEAIDPNAEPALLPVDRELRLDGSWTPRVPAWIIWKHHRFDEASGVDREDVIRDSFVYNGATSDDRTSPVHDFFVEFEVEIVSGSGLLLCRMWDGHDLMVASCPVGAANPEAFLRHDGFGIVRNSPRKPLQEKKKYRIEMAFVDRRVSFAIDGREPFAAYDLDPLKARADVIAPVAIGVQGVQGVIRDMKIYRDIYYRSSGRNAVDEPLQLASDEYFMLGDNSANSDDSRSWPIPGVPERNYLGKPFLLHQPSRITHMTIGGRERVFQSIDWSRIRFLR